jgi:carbon monoxide dehydrogenase subunit G
MLGCDFHHHWRQLMPEIRIEEEIRAAADAVWPVVSDFAGITRFMAGLEKVEVQGSGIGAVRTVTVTGGNKLQERLESFDPKARSFSYSILPGAMPVQNYLATVKLADAGAGRSRITWSARFDAPGMPEAQSGGLAKGMEQAYGAAIAGLKKIVEK